MQLIALRTEAGGLPRRLSLFTEEDQCTDGNARVFIVDDKCRFEESNGLEGELACNRSARAYLRFRLHMPLRRRTSGTSGLYRHQPQWCCHVTYHATIAGVDHVLDRATVCICSLRSRPYILQQPARQQSLSTLGHQLDHDRKGRSPE